MLYDENLPLLLSFFPPIPENDDILPDNSLKIFNQRTLWTNRTIWKKKIVCFKILVSKSWIFWDWNITKIPRVFNNFLLNRWIAILNRKKKSWPEVPILFQNLRSELAYTFNWTKSTARLWRFVNELWKEKKKSPYLPTHRWNGGSRAGNEHIFKGGLILNDTLMSGISHVEIPAINVVFLNNLGL
jgi:hypothetical protein